MYLGPVARLFAEVCYHERTRGCTIVSKAIRTNVKSIDVFAYPGIEWRENPLRWIFDFSHQILSARLVQFSKLRFRNLTPEITRILALADVLPQAVENVVLQVSEYRGPNFQQVLKAAACHESTVLLYYLLTGRRVRLPGLRSPSRRRRPAHNQVPEEKLSV